MAKKQAPIPISLRPWIEARQRFRLSHALDGCRADHDILGGIQAVTQHGQTRRLRQDPPTEKDGRNAIERTAVSATRIEIVLNESVVAEGQDRV